MEREENKEILLAKADNLSLEINNLKKSIIKFEKEVKDTKDEFLELGIVSDVLVQLKDIKMETKKQFILDTINLALFDIFQNDIKIDIKSITIQNGTNKATSKYDIILYQNGVEISKNEKLLDNNGGGILSVISILFKMIVGYIYSDNKFYMFDESLSQVSAEYRPRLSQFLQLFCAKHKFSLVLVSHTKDLEEYADLVYKLDAVDKAYNITDIEYKKFIDTCSEHEKKKHLEILNSNKNNTIYLPSAYISETLGDYPKDNYYYTNISNFQSIEKPMHLRFKGFTIIRGKNNIGKSASLRAIQSLLFNNFDIKDFPRKYKKKKDITSVEFGYKISEDIEDNKNIKLFIKGNKLYIHLIIKNMLENN